MAGLITTLILMPLVGALFVSVSRQDSARAASLGFNALARFRFFFAKFDRPPRAQWVRPPWIPRWADTMGIDAWPAPRDFDLAIFLSFLAQRMSRGRRLDARDAGALFGRQARIHALVLVMNEPNPGSRIELGRQNRDRAATKSSLTFLGSVRSHFIPRNLFARVRSISRARRTRQPGLCSTASRLDRLRRNILGLRQRPLFPFTRGWPDLRTAPIGVSSFDRVIRDDFKFCAPAAPLFPRSKSSVPGSSVWRFARSSLPHSPHGRNPT